MGLALKKKKNMWIKSIILAIGNDAGVFEAFWEIIKMKFINASVETYKCSSNGIKYTNKILEWPLFMEVGNNII